MASPMRVTLGRPRVHDISMAPTFYAAMAEAQETDVIKLRHLEYVDLGLGKKGARMVDVIDFSRPLFVDLERFCSQDEGAVGGFKFHCVRRACAAYAAWDQARRTHRR